MAQQPDGAIYIVRPLPQLIELIEAIGADWGNLVTQPQIISRLEGSGELSWRTLSPLRDAQVKTMYLLWLRSEYFGDGTSDFGAFLKKLVRFPLIDVVSFNSWWYLERFDCISDDFDRFLNGLKQVSLEDIRSQPDIIGFDEWMSTITSPR